VGLLTTVLVAAAGDDHRAAGTDPAAGRAGEKARTAVTARTALLSSAARRSTTLPIPLASFAIASRGTDRLPRAAAGLSGTFSICRAAFSDDSRSGHVTQVEPLIDGRPSANGVCGMENRYLTILRPAGPADAGLSPA
jgi:hypothetical protein